MRIYVVINTVGIILRYVALIMLLPVIFALFYKEYSSILPFLTGFLVSLGLGGLFSLNKASEKDIDTINKAEALATAFFSWVLFALVCSIPYLFYNLGVVNSLFEAVSGVSTTGATIINDFSLYPKTFFFYRSMTQWFGGMGIIVLFIAILPKFSVAGRQMFFAESPNPVEEKVTPRIRHTASWLWAIYVGLTVLQIIILKFAGLDFFHSICTSFSTVGAGGFSPNADGTIGYGSNFITVIIMIFAFLAGTNFIILYKFFIQGKFKAPFKSEEFLTYLSVVLILGGLISLSLCLNSGYAPKDGIIAGLFQTISVMTSTGFASVDFAAWDFSSKLLLFMAMFVSASAISACGGLKITRWIFVFKYIKRELNKIMHPNGVYPIRLEGGVVNSETAQQIMAFVVFYFALFGITAFITGFIEQNSTIAVVGSISMLGNIGPGFGALGPMESFDSLHTATKFVFMFNMLIGRLELIPFLAILHKDLWAIKKG